MLYLCMSFSVLLVMLFGYVFYLNRQIADLNKKIDTRRTGSDDAMSSES
jgi:cell division protein FtsL